jgi:hypothetical protein
MREFRTAEAGNGNVLDSVALATAAQLHLGVVSVEE